MYSVSDAVELGNAHELVLSLMKDVLVQDDAEPLTQEALEHFEE